jgi:hypothetical protein
MNVKFLCLNFWWRLGHHKSQTSMQTSTSYDCASGHMTKINTWSFAHCVHVCGSCSKSGCPK